MILSSLLYLLSFVPRVPPKNRSSESGKKKKNIRILHLFNQNLSLHSFFGSSTMKWKIIPKLALALDWTFLCVILLPSLKLKFPFTHVTLRGIVYRHTNVLPSSFLLKEWTKLKENPIIVITEKKKEPFCQLCIAAFVSVNQIKNPH